MHDANSDDLARFLLAGIERLRREDPELHAVLTREYRRQASVLSMVASSSIADPSALVCEALPAMNVTRKAIPARASTPDAFTSTRSSSSPSIVRAVSSARATRTCSR
jgi:hypothetical protein